MCVHTRTGGPKASMLFILPIPVTGWDAGAHFLGGIWGESWEAHRHCWSRVHQNTSPMAGGSGASSGNVAICHIKSFTNN